MPLSIILQQEFILSASTIYNKLMMVELVNLKSSLSRLNILMAMEKILDTMFLEGITYHSQNFMGHTTFGSITLNSKEGLHILYLSTQGPIITKTLGIKVKRKIFSQSNVQCSLPEIYSRNVRNCQQTVLNLTVTDHTPALAKHVSDLYIPKEDQLVSIIIHPWLYDHNGYLWDFMYPEIQWRSAE